MSLLPASRFPDSICTRCGCTCNDITLQVDQGRIVAADHACELGRNGFIQDLAHDVDPCLIEGQTATIKAGIARAAEILRTARYPLIYGMRAATTEDQRQTVALADWIGGVIDTPQSKLRGPVGTTFRGVGDVTATLGEVRNRSDLVVFWGCNPAETHPRHLELYSLLPHGEFLPNGRTDRTCIVIDPQPTATSQQADHFFQLRPGSDFEAIWILRGILAGILLDPAEVERSTDVPLSSWQVLLDQLKRASYAAIFYSTSLTKSAAGHVQAEALQALVKDLNRYARVVCRSLGNEGNLTGAEQVLTWTTGYPNSVNLAKGYPRYNPGEYSAEEVLSRHEVDAAVILGSDSMLELCPAAQEHLANIPTIVIDCQNIPSKKPFTVHFRAAIPGIHSSGTVYRVDGIALPVRGVLSSPLPSQTDLLTQIEQTLRPI